MLAHLKSATREGKKAPWKDKWKRSRIAQEAFSGRRRDVPGEQNFTGLVFFYRIGFWVIQFLYCYSPFSEPE